MTETCSRRGTTTLWLVGVIVVAGLGLIAANGSLTGLFTDTVQEQADDVTDQTDDQVPVDDSPAATDQQGIRVQWSANHNPGPNDETAANPVDYLVYRIQPDQCAGESSCPISDFKDEVNWQDHNYERFTDGRTDEGDPICQSGSCGFTDTNQYAEESDQTDELQERVLTAAGLKGNAWYCYKITAFNDADRENPSGDTDSTSQVGQNLGCVNTLPSPPEEVEAVLQNDSTSSYISLSWLHTNSEGTQYRIEGTGFTEDGSVTHEFERTVPVNLAEGEQYTETLRPGPHGVLKPNRRYELEVQALSWEGAPSAGETVDIWAPAVKPGFEDEYLFVKSSARVDVNWTHGESSNASEQNTESTEYEVYKTSCDGKIIDRPTDSSPEPICTIDRNDEGVQGAAQGSCIYRGQRSSSGIIDYDVEPSSTQCYKLVALHKEAQQPTTTSDIERTLFTAERQVIIEDTGWHVGGEDWTGRRVEGSISGTEPVQIIQRTGVTTGEDEDGIYLRLQDGVVAGEITLLFNGGVERDWFNHTRDVEPGEGSINFGFTALSEQQTGSVFTADADCPEGGGQGEYLAQTITLSRDAPTDETPKVYWTEVDHTPHPQQGHEEPHEC